MQTPSLATNDNSQLCQFLSLFQKSIRCTLPNCNCQCFEPGTKSPNQLRICDCCNHSWVVHALDKLRVSNPYQMAHVEPVTSSSAFDVASLALYGTRAIPIRVKLLLDRIFAQLPPDHLLQVLQRLNWSHEDYMRGYMQVDNASGTPIDQWTMANRDEEAIIIQQFFRFAETKSLAHELLLQDAKDRQESFQQAISLSTVGNAESQIRRFLETGGLGASTGSPNILQASALASALGNLAGSPFASSLANLVPTTSVQQLQNTLATPRVNSNSSAVPSSPLSLLQSRSFMSSVTPNNEQVIGTGLPLNLVKKDQPSRCSSTTGLTNANKQRLSLPMTPADNSLNDEVNVTDEPQNRLVSNEPKTNRASFGSIDRSSYGYGGTIVSPTTGKKRVLCQACGKTFCDKGALKIHYSAVHLREMHRCSIPGCNMYFSSRRSRNRHSANPNPKLHSPYRQRVIDGRPMNDMPVTKSNSISNFEDNASNASENRRITASNDEDEDREIVVANMDDGEMGGYEGENGDEESGQNLTMGIKRRNSFSASQSDDENGGIVEGSASTFNAETSVAVASAPAASKRRKSSAPVRVVRFDQSESDFPELAVDEGDEQEEEELRDIPSPSSTISEHASSTNDVSATGDQHVEPAIEIPVDPNNPRQCPTCKKFFQNPFSMRLHYQNVHLKVKHYCTVPGCNSVFPSKRSRDRHASNINLHRRLSSVSNGIDLSSTASSVNAVASSPPASSPSASNEATNQNTLPQSAQNLTSSSSETSPNYDYHQQKELKTDPEGSWSSQTSENKNSQTGAAITAV